MPQATRQKITLEEMRESGVRGLLIYCSDYRCSHWTAISGDRWDIEGAAQAASCGLSRSEPLDTFEHAGLSQIDPRRTSRLKCVS
jgi:hypothetical protein